MMSEKPVFKEVLQVCMVVKNLDEALKRYWEVCAIGPWEIYTLDSSDMQDVTIRGHKAEFSMKVALTNVGNMQLELIEPLDDKSIYSEFLEKHGEGLHHIACAVDDYDDTISRLKDKGIGILQGGITKEGLGFAYLDTQEALSCITEIYKFPENLKQPIPDASYP
jgi:methylmalonyl-CoA epimerase